MSKFDKDKVMPRYLLVVGVFALIGVAVVAKSMYIMTAKKDYWMEVASRLKADSVRVKPNRGNILSCDGQLMASTIPEYKIYMDFVTVTSGPRKDSLWNENLDTICKELHEIFPEQSAEAFRKHLQKGFQRRSRNWPVWKRRIDYTTFQAVKALPVFRMSKYKGGFHWEEYNARRRPFGSLAQRTIGDLYGAKDEPRFGLEMTFDSILRGTDGLTHRRKVLNKWMNIPVEAPVDGADIVTTIDVGMQDLAERALITELKKINAYQGVVVLMDVPTGDIKAIVNMSKCADGEYREIKNAAVSDLLEPGSVFKTASLLVALDDGVVDTTYMVDTGSGVWKMYGRNMKDHNWRRGGYQVISLPRCLEVSSNIGVSRIIDDHYHDKPEKFVEGIYRVGLGCDLDIPLVGSAKPVIRMPKKNSRGQYVNWSNTALAWMSIGYESQVPPISTVAFYNGIANNGRLVKPRFVKKVVKNGVTLKEFPVEVVREQMCSPKALKEMQTILEHVVSQGLGKRAGSKLFKVAGKTGTAQVARNGGYKNGVTHYLVSFAGYFPADNPRYSCVVCIQKSGLPASGGTMSGQVFHDIAEGVMAKDVKISIEDAVDTAAHHLPMIKPGNIYQAGEVLEALDIATDKTWGQRDDASPLWGMAELSGQQVKMRPAAVRTGVVPDVRGMGARDAVYCLESGGLKVRLKGRGKVKTQSEAPGTELRKGVTCQLVLE